MAALLLKTKLYVPSLRPEFVSRPRLIGRLNAGLHHRLTLISAPAGFGKTTLLSEWAASCGQPVAWVSLNKGDNDPIRFWSYFIVALQTIHATVGESALAALQSPQSLPIESILTALINEITEESVEPRSYILVLDDCHLIEARPIYDALTFLLDHLPPQMHLVIATRADPPLPLSRLRGRGQLVELRSADLRFTPDEVVAFFNDVMGLSLSAESAAALEARTEGWIVGLQMAALALRSLRTPRSLRSPQESLSMQGQDAKHVADFVAAFTGSHRYVLDYLADEVLLQQPEGVQTFLLRTSILDRLTGPLCDAVTDQSNSQEMLKQLDAANLFIVPLDDERRWYRYHHLFADLLRKRLRQTQPDQVPLLHRRASRWHEMNGLVAEAVGHALAAGDADRAARLVERNALAMMDHGELTTLLGWLGALPDVVLRRRPWLCVAYAWTLAYSGQLDAIEPLLQDAEKALVGIGEATAEAPVLSEAEVQHTAGHITTIRTYVATLRGEYACAVEFARKALELLPEDDLATRGFAASQLAFALRTTDGLAAATQAAIEASTISQAAGDSHVAVMTLCDLAGLLNLQGWLHEAAATYRDALRLTEEYAKRSGRQLPVTGYVYGRMSTILCEWNDLEAAVHLARKGVELCERWGWTEPFIDCCFYLASALQAAGYGEEALNVIREAKQAALGLSPWYAAIMDMAEVRIQLALGDLVSASRWAAAQEGELSIGDEPYSQYVARYLTLVRILITQAWAHTGGECDRVDPAWEDKLERALESLTGLLRRAEEHCYTARVIEIHIRQALILQALGRVEEALPVLERALSITESGGHVRAFVNKGTPMEKLLRQAAAHGIAVERVGKLLAAFRQVASPSFSPSPLIEPLSEREIEILRLIAAGLSNREIAAELFLTIGTVKRHASNIYGKLNVHKRTQAVARARELGLL